MPKPASKRQKEAYERISPATIAEICQEAPPQVRRLWIGITGDGKERNYQYEIGGRIIRRSLKHPDKLDAKTFNPRNIVEVDPRTGALLELQD
jgi:hypothetical protein